MLIDIPRVEYKNTKSTSKQGNNGADLEAAKLNEQAFKEQEEQRQAQVFQKVKLSDID